MKVFKYISDYEKQYILQEVFKPVSEGWDTLFTKLLPFGFLLSAGISEVKVRKILSDNKAKKFIIDQCKETFKEAKKSNKNLTTKIPTDIMVRMKNPIEDDRTFWQRYKWLLTHNLGFYKLGEFEATVISDHTHIDGICILVWDTKKEAIQILTVKPPSIDRGAKYGYFKDDDINID